MKLDFILKGDKRSRKALKNIAFSFGVKGMDSIVQLLLVPVTLGYLNAYEYGIWLTLNSILLWINSFDIGLGNGLRNQLAIAVAKSDKELARSLVSTAFGMIAIIMTIILCFGSPIVLNLDWYNILGTDIDSVPNLISIVYISFALFCLNFMMKFVGNVYLAMQMPAINNLLVSLGHLLSLVIIYVLTKYSSGGLLYVATAFSVSPVIVYIIAYPITFRLVYRDLSPSISLFRKRHLSSLFNVGVQFFILQLFGILLFSLSNIIISKLFGPDQVTPYNISFRYFSLVTMLVSIAIAPMWSACTDAYARGEIDWVKKILRKTEYLLLMIAFVLFIMVLISGYIYHVWIGDEVAIPTYLTISMAVYVYIIACSTSYSFFLNGLGKLRIQMLNTVIVAIAFVPTTILFSRLFDIEGVVIAMILTNITGLILNRIQLYKILNNKAYGLWNK